MSPRSPLPVEWTEAAAEDLGGILDYLLDEKLPFAAVEDYVARIYNAHGEFAALPGAGKPGRAPGTREWRVKDTPYELVYRVRTGRVQILRVMHDSRQFPGE